MGLIVKPYTFSAGAVIVAAEHNSNFDVLYAEINGNLSTANLSASAGIVDTQLATISTAGKVSGASFTSLASIPSGAGVIPSANLPSLVTASYRYEMFVMQASTTTMTVAPGTVAVGNVGLAKTANTTLTLTTNGDWAGGASLRATNTTGYVGIDQSGNIKMHTTAPTHADYALTITAANNTKRYVAWDGTTYRVIGWFRMNATGSGELDVFGVSNLADGSVANIVEFQTGAVATGTTTIPYNDSIPQNTEGDEYMSQIFRPTNVNNKIKITVLWNGASSGDDELTVALFQDSTANALCAVDFRTGDSNGQFPIPLQYTMKAGTIALTTFKVRAGTNSSTTVTFNGSAGGRKYGGVCNSYIRVEELESQLT